MFYTRKTGEALRDSGVKKLLRYFIGKRGINQCSPHSFRKGGARFMFDNNVRIENISTVLNHHSTKITEKYICITPGDIEKSMACLEI
jgi:integrase